MAVDPTGDQSRRTTRLARQRRTRRLVAGGVVAIVVAAAAGIFALAGGDAHEPVAVRQLAPVTTAPPTAPAPKAATGSRTGRPPTRTSESLPARRP
jgi:hypothetical protein